MAKYRLSNGNTILAEQDFIDKHYPDAVLIVEQEDTRTAIIDRLAEIDRLSDTPRARREARLGNTVWIKKLDDEAAALRLTLKGM